MGDIAQELDDAADCSEAPRKWWTTMRNAAEEIRRLRVAAKLGRDCVMESFDYVKTTDDQVMADARLQAIDAALPSLSEQ